MVEENPKSLKREDFMDWEDYFMATAFLAAKRSKDPVTQVGACIVSPDNKIVGIGYNGMPTGCSDDEFPWGKQPNSLESKYLYVCHAEMNAILNKNVFNVKGCKIYVALFPCNECAKFIIQSGITEVIYMSDKYADKIETKASKRMFDAVGITYKQYKPKQSRVVIDFDEVNWNNMRQEPGTPHKHQNNGV
ncbi:deoxycytidylate deaminase [Onthophagus taurus]|uniref:deoxycytidylate deaminase n=1 Tax=Onthophagus taurus TaxID=166361 RepID=UPI000C20A3AC|nr:deoxycytidylate deaminase-like [Onthophagus taurus]